MERIVESLQTMQSASKLSARPRFDPYLDKYRGWLLDLERDRWGGSFLLELDRAEREVKSLFDPASAEIAAGEPSPAPAGTRPPADTGTLGFLYRSWESAHRALAEAWSGRQDASKPYQDTVAALKLLKGQLAGGRADLVQYQIDWYAALHEKTSGFTRVPPGSKETDVAVDLAVPSRVIEKEFKPVK
jgi:hypothetical protein